MKYMTKQSQLILSIVARYGHVTADEVHREAKKSMPKIAVGTVYRNLNELAETGIIIKSRCQTRPTALIKP
ncbi:MAG: transcriptional repressor [Clostridia bacterium]|nr:transcriptional repressor [Clostridia bacterium]